jgi:hypothetical protein
MLANTLFRSFLVKPLFLAVIIFCMTTISFAVEQVQTVYDGAVLTEDSTWSGSVLVRNSVVVAPQATLRIEPGTVVRFAATAAGQLPNLVIQGRLHAAGTAEQPVLFTSERAKPPRGSWGGIVFLATEKRNLLEHSRIESAITGVDVRFSTVTLKSVTIVRSQTGILINDGVVQMTGGTVSESETGIEAHQSEFDGRDITVESCQYACIGTHSALVLTSPRVANNGQTGLDAQECRLRITGGEFAGNTMSARVTEGEGQIVMARFLLNRQTALQLNGSRLKIQRCLFTENLQDGVRVEDDRSLLLNNAFISNGGFHLYNAGRQTADARQNWWGTVDPTLIRKKIRDTAFDTAAGTVQISPWLSEKPLLIP